MAIAVTTAACSQDPEAQPAVTATTDQPNVVLISIDTLRRDHLSFYGFPHDTTPNLARLAREAVVFDQAIAVHVNTAPSHASMLTGLHPGSHGILQNGLALKSDVATLAERLRDAGYTTAAFVSGWTLAKDHTKLDRGFDVYDDDMTAGRERFADETVDATLGWLANAKPPFFLFVHLFDPHFPYRSAHTRWEKRFERWLAEIGIGVPPFSDDEKRTRYVSEIAFADAQIGRLLAAIESQALLDASHVFFTSDHGETLDERTPSFDHGGRVYEEQIRIPLVWRQPQAARAGTRVASPVSQVDLLPTIASVLRIEAADPSEGRSLLPLLDAESAEDRARTTFSHARADPGRVPEVEATVVQGRLVSAIRTPEAKLVEYPTEDGGYRERFDLVGDPEETAGNVSSPEDPLASALDRFERDTGVADASAPEFDTATQEGLRALGYIE